ncbi:MAG TPA: hypothetical protein VFA65_22555 [Bryobacteraceae bacterium]|nr:hypothetical protein [Bryobacteraceae bacterium]
MSGTTRSSRRLPGPSRTGGSIHVSRRVAITAIKPVRVTFKSDHHMMTDNNADWTNSGSVFPKPEWTTRKPSNPISHTKNQKVEIEVDFDVAPANASETVGDVAGIATFCRLFFSASKQKFKGGLVTVSVRSTTPLLDMVEKLSGDIQWRVTTVADGAFDVGSSSGHTIYVTWDTPISVSGHEAGITQKRMELAVKLVGDAIVSAGYAESRLVPEDANQPVSSNISPHWIVNDLMRQVKGYELVPNPNVPAQFDHPQYFNDRGGAWTMADYLSYSAECQAIVRFYRAVIKQVGCPGLAQIMAVYARPDVDNGNTVLEDDMETNSASGLNAVSPKRVGDRSFVAALLDKDPGSDPGKIFDGNRRGRIPGIGLNTFEACLKFTFPEPQSGATPEAGATQYYAGGTGGSVMDNKERVIKVFWALVWYSFVLGQPGEYLVKVEEIVARYR